MLGNAIKMAFKSLWTSKMRTFLTMLGVIIGVTTVALLTTVSNGATQSIMDALGRESRMITLLTSSTKKSFTLTELNALASGLEKNEANGTFTYTAVAKGDVVIEKSSHKINGEFNGEALVFRIGSTVNAVDDKFVELRDLKVDGRFAQAADECVVDREFINAFLKGKSDSEVLNSTVFLGGKIATYNYSFKSKVKADIEEFHKELVKMLDEKGYTGEIPEYDESLIIEDGEYFVYESYVDPIESLDPDSLLTRVYNHIDGLDYEFAEGYSVTIDETFEGGKDYEIVGILVEEDAALMGSGDTQSNMGQVGGNIGALIEYSKRKQGNVYVTFSDDNAHFFEKDVIEDVQLNGAYFLFDSEDVIDAASINMGLGMMNLGFPNLFEDFMIIPMKTVSQIMGATMDILTIMLTVIASISLIIGGIGIMNIMLVAVTERTREIGIRKAIGAKKSSIRLQFLIEALIVSLIGGGIGLFISFIGSLIIGSVMGIALAMPLWVIAMSLGFCVLIGVIFGMYPAIKASNLMPIDALRHD